MYYILSITKHSNHTKHYYGVLYSGAGSYVDLFNLYNKFYDNYDFKSQFRNLEKVGVVLTKRETEKELIKDAVNVIKKQYLSDWLIVFYNGNYSESRSDFAQSVRREK